jgi:mannitol-1-phosphate 5-dehydrogenase
MQSICKNKIVIFGAGKIGRSFIGQLFSLGGYKVVFVDVYKPIIDELNKRGNYNVIVKSGKDETLNIKNVRGVYAGNEQEVVQEVATAGILAVSVGSRGLKNIFPSLAKGLLERYRIDKNYALDIIIAENMLNSDDYFHQQLSKFLPESYPLSSSVGLIETSIGKMVPIMQKKDIQEDILQIFAEPYNTLILNKKGFRNPVPSIDGLDPKENIKAWVDRKFFIHNLGHSAAAYISYLYHPNFIYLHEGLALPEILNYVRSVMLQSAEILLKKHPDEFTSESLVDHTDDLLVRFQNKALGDTIFRVGCDLTRKLGPQDRLAGAIKELETFNLDYNKILFTLVCACHFRAVDEDGKMMKEDIEFANLYNTGIEMVLTKICGFDKTSDSRLLRYAKSLDDQIKMNSTSDQIALIWRILQIP